jgi:hypothetical protein
MVDLAGKYELESMEVRDSNGEVSYPFGRDIMRVVTYGSGGAMSTQLMRSDRPSFTSRDIQADGGRRRNQGRVDGMHLLFWDGHHG